MKDNSENTMAPYIRKTVEEIDEDIEKLAGDIARLRGTRETLVELYGGDSLIPAAVETVAPTAVRTPGRRKKMCVDVRRVKPGADRGAGTPGQGTRPTTAGAAGALDLNKPTTIAGAMKLIIPTLATPFTVGEVIEKLNADADWQKLMAEEGAELRPGANLAYWAKTGKVHKAAEGADALYTNISIGRNTI